MEVYRRLHGSKAPPPPPPAQPNKDMQVKRGPWTVEEDLALINNIAEHGEGQWNKLARRAELNRTGKSCRLRWLNYLRPDVRRGNFTVEEQLLILELQSRWGNRWSKIARCLPHRTDNEIKNYWRTRVQKLAKKLQCDVNSNKFRDAIKAIWIPCLLEQAQAASDGSTTITTSASDLCASQSVAPDLSKQEEQVMAPCSNRAGQSPTSSEYSFLTWSTPSADDETNLEWDIHAQTSIWYDEAGPWGFGQGGWASEDLQSDEYLWSMEENWTMRQQI